MDEDVVGSPLFFDAQSLDDDEWKARDRALLFLWQTPRALRGAARGTRQRPRRAGRRSISSGRRTATSIRIATRRDQAPARRHRRAISTSSIRSKRNSYDTSRLARCERVDRHVRGVRQVARAGSRPADVRRAVRPGRYDVVLARTRRGAGTRSASRGFHRAREEDDARRMARYLAFDAQRFLRQRPDRDHRAADLQGRPRAVSGRRTGLADLLQRVSHRPAERPERRRARRAREREPESHDDLRLDQRAHDRRARKAAVAVLSVARSRAPWFDARRARRSWATRAPYGSCRRVCETLFDTLFANLPTSDAPPQRADRRDGGYPARRAGRDGRSGQRTE